METSLNETSFSLRHELIVNTVQPSLNILVTRVLPASQKGDLAIALSQLSALRTRFPGSEITLLCRRPAGDGHHFQAADSVLPELFPTETSEPRLRRLLRLLRILTGLGKDRDMLRFDRLCQAADVLVFCGGGSLGGYGFGNLVLHALCPSLMARRAGLPVCFSAISVHDYKNPVHRLLHKSVLKNADAVTARDPRSFAVLEMLKVHGAVGLTADWAWLLPAVDKQEAEALLASEGVTGDSGLRIGINLRSILAIDPEKRASRGDFDYRQAMARIISELVTRTGAEVVVFSMNRPPASDDLAFAQQVYSRIDQSLQHRVHVLKGDYMPGQIKGMIARLSLFVGTRLHPSLFAISSMVPTLTVHDQAKVAALMDYAGLSEWHSQASGIEPASFVDKLIALQEKRIDIIETLKMKVPQLRAMALGNLDHIAECTDWNNKTIQ